MSGNSTGIIFRLTSFGESHGRAIGGIIDGCPPRLTIDEIYIQKYLDRRRPGYADWASARKEQDSIEILSGVFEGYTTGAPLAFLIRNKDHKPEDYEELKDVLRPSHADYAIEKKYGIRDYRGGGRLSGRETAARVAGGSIARLYLEKNGIRIVAFTTRIGNITAANFPKESLTEYDVYNSLIRNPDPVSASEMADYLLQMKKEGDSTGGIVTCIVRGVPAGLGEPVFDKLHANLAKAVMSIGGARGVEFGAGFSSSLMKGSEHNDPWKQEGNEFITETNHSGGIQGGISNGMDIEFRVAFKPVASIARTQKTLDNSGREVEYSGKGRHDVCIVPRAVPVVEAMTSLVLADHLLIQNSYR